MQPPNDVVQVPELGGDQVLRSEGRGVDGVWCGAGGEGVWRVCSAGGCAAERVRAGGG